MAKRIAAEAFVIPLAAETAVDMVYSETGEALAREGKVTVRGFGRFTTTRRAKRVGRNPRTVRTNRDTGLGVCVALGDEGSQG